MTGKLLARYPLFPLLSPGTSTTGSPRRGGRAWGWSREPRRRCPERRASGQDLWEGGEKTPTRDEEAGP